MLQTIYVLNKEILQFLGLKSAVYNQERFQIKSGFKSRAAYNVAHTVDVLPRKLLYLGIDTVPSRQKLGIIS